MRPAAVAMAIALAVGLPCLVGAADSLWRLGLPLSLYGTLLGVGFSLGLIGPVLLDIAYWRAEADSLLRQREAHNYATELANMEREARLATPSKPVENTENTDETPAWRKRQKELALWQTFYRRLFAALAAYGWTIRGVTSSGIVSQEGWTIGTDQLAKAGYLTKDKSGTRPTVTEAEWNAGRLWEKCPCPAGEPPDIQPPPYTPQQTRHRTAAQTVVIDNESVKE